MAVFDHPEYDDHEQVIFCRESARVLRQLSPSTILPWDQPRAVAECGSIRTLGGSRTEKSTTALG
jgi:hypothetical protein